MYCKKCGQLLLKTMNCCPNCGKTKDPTKQQLSKLHDFIEQNQLNLGLPITKRTISSNNRSFINGIIFL